MRISDLILSLDGYGEPIELNFQGKRRFNTYCGSFITTFVFVVFILYSLQQFLFFAQKNDFAI